jgi:hypothetical protein
MFCESKPNSFRLLRYNFRTNELTLCYQLMVFVRWQRLSLLTHSS